MTSEPSTPQRPHAAFIHRGAWGDLYVSTAALKEVCERHDSVVVVGSGKWLELLTAETWPKVREIWVSEDGWSGQRYELANGAWAKREAVPLRRLLGAVNTTYNMRTESLRYGWAPLLASVPRRHGSAPFPWGRLLYTHRAPWIGMVPMIHERDRLLRVVEAPDQIGELAKKYEKTIGLPTLKKADRANGEKLAGAKAGTYWLFNPTSSRREKAWPSPRLKELLRTLHPKFEAAGLTWRVIGAPNETEWLKEVLPEEFDAKTYIVQPAKISDLCDVLAGARALVTNTSSMQFLAPGYGVRTLTIAGITKPAIWRPLGPQDEMIFGTIDPSLQDRIFEQEQKAFESIPFEKVLAKCLEVFEAQRNS